MPEISTTFTLNDQMSGKLKGVISSVESLTKVADKLGDQLGLVDDEDFNNLHSSLSKLTKGFGDVSTKAQTTSKKISTLKGNNLRPLESSARNAANAVGSITDQASQASASVERLGNSTGGLTTGITRLVGAFGGLQGAKAILNWSDEITQTTSRLNMVNKAFNGINNAQQTTRDLQNQIYKAAQRSRGSYSDLENLVASLGNNAKDAFKSTEELVTFAEALSKTFAISGASAEEMSNATLQLTQGLASGTLRGDELNSVLEQAPALTNVLNKALGTNTGQLRDMAAEGKLTAETVKNAVLSSASDIDTEFQGMDTTFSQMWTRFANMAQHAIEPISKYAAAASASLMGVFSAMQMISEVNEAGGVRSFLTGNEALPKNKTSKGKMPGTNLRENTTKALTGSGKALANLIPSPVIKAVDTLTSKFKKLAATTLITANINGSILVDDLGKASAKMKSFGSSILGAISNSKVFTAVLSPLGKAFGGVVTSIAPLIGSLGGIAGMATLAVTGVGLLGAALGKLNENGQASEKVDSFFKNFTQSVSTFGDKAVSAINEFVETLPQKLPQLIEQGSKLVGSIITGLANAIPQLLATGGQIVGALLTGLIKSLPTVVSGGVQFIGNLAQSITDNAPTFFSKAGELISGFMSYLTTNIPLFFQSGADMLANLLNGFASNFPSMLQKGLELIGQMLNNFREHFPEFLQQGVELIGSIVSGIGQALPTIASAVWNVIVSIVSTLWDNRGEIVHAGWDLLCALGEGLLNVAGFLWDTLLNVGGQIIEGIKTGISNAWNGFTSWLSETFWGIVDAIKGVFGIHSPSTIMKDEVGANLVEGLKQGISGAWGGLMDVASSLWNSFLGLFNGGGEQEDQLIDYSAQIAQTQEQLATLQAQVDAGYTNILNTVQVKNAEIVQAGIGMFTQMTTTVIADAQTMVAGINTVFSQIPLVVQNTFAATLPIVQANLVTMTAMANDQIAQLVVRAQQALFEIVPAFQVVLTGLQSMVLAAIGSMNDGIISLTQAFGGNYENIFATTFDNVIALFNSFQVRAVASTNEMIAAVDKTLDSQLPKVFNDAAVNAMDSYVAGIRSNISKATSVTSELVEQVKATFIKGLGIHSPSDVTYWYGQMTGQGFINGLSDSQLVAFAKNILLEMVNAFNGGKFNADELVAYLDEDSLKVIDAYKKWPDIFEAAMPGVDMSIPGIVAAAREEIGYTASEGGSKFGAGAWCAWFVKAMAERAGVPFPNSGYVPNIKDWAVANNRWTQEPKSGYAVIFDWNGGDSGSHIGIVETVNPDGTITTIEGNTTGETSNSGVFRKKRSANIIGYVALDGGTGYGGQNGIVAAIQAAYNKIHGWGSLVLDPYATMTGNIPWDPKAGAEQWRSQVQTALQMLGQPLSYTDDILYAITCESSGNPNAINLTDSNAAAGRHSRGLMQTIPSTFQAYAYPGFNTNIWDPLSNILAGINYMIQSYGSIENVMRDRRGHWRGYAVGTRYVPQDMLAMIHKGEAIIPASQNPYRDSGGDYLTEIAERTISEPPDLSMQNLAGEVVPTYQSGNSNITVNLSFGDINNHGDLDHAKEEIIHFVDQELTVAIKRTGSVEHGY